MKKPGPVSEGLAVVLWSASAVKVAGYTWQAFTGTYSQFPSPGGGGGGASGGISGGLPHADPGRLGKLPIIGPALPKIPRRKKGQSVWSWIWSQLLPGSSDGNPIIPDPFAPPTGHIPRPHTKGGVAIRPGR